MELCRTADLIHLLCVCVSDALPAVSCLWSLCVSVCVWDLNQHLLKTPDFLSVSNSVRVFHGAAPTLHLHLYDNFWIKAAFLNTLFILSFSLRLSSCSYVNSKLRLRPEACQYPTRFVGLLFYVKRVDILFLPHRKANEWFSCSVTMFMLMLGHGLWPRAFWILREQPQMTHMVGLQDYLL